MNAILKEFAACDDCEWTGPSSDLLVCWNEKNDMLFQCPVCQSHHLFFIDIETLKLLKTLSSPSNNLKPSQGP